MHANWTESVAEDHENQTENFCSSPSSCKVETYWPESVSFSTLKKAGEEYPSKTHAKASPLDRECSDVDLDNNSFESEGSGSDSSIDSNKNKKGNRWLRPFFDMLEHISTDLPAENVQDTLFYCPACRGSGLGEVSVYKGFKPLIAHAKQYKQRRVKLHRDFAAILEEDLKRSGIYKAEPGQIYPVCKQISLSEDEKFTNLLIVWPPTVVVHTMGIEVEGHPKRVGMKNREILDILKGYHPRKVIRAYVHEENDRLLSLVFFRDSPMGYMNAKRLAKNFKHSKQGRLDWDNLGNLKLRPAYDGMLFGYMAKEEDMLLFTSHDTRKTKVKWDLKRYQDVVIDPLMQMHEAKLENSWLKIKLQEQEEHNKDLEKIVSKLYAKQELDAEEINFASQIPTKHLEAPSERMSGPHQTEMNCDDDGDGWRVSEIS